ncbi:MAG: hypothetical protein HY617_02725 [Candidatus Sungbacteria bacterium]|nr:hypothetical protein [Candidatus Sungbacteria bacterium]
MHLSSSSWKEIFFCVVFLFLHVLTFWMWYRIIPVIIQGDFEQYGFFIFPLVLLIFAASLFSLVVLLVQHKTLLVCVMTAAILVPFGLAFPSTYIALGVVVLNVLLMWFAVSMIRKEVAASLLYRIPKFLKHGLGFYFTAVALVLSLFYLNRIDDQKVFSILFPQQLFDFTLRAFSGTIQGATGLPPIRPEQTVNEIMTGLVRTQLQSQGIPFEKIPKQELSRLLAFQRDEFAKSYGISLGGGERIGTVFATATISKVKDMIGEYTRYLPLVAAAAFFFAFKALSIVFRWISIFLAVLLMKLLILVKVVKKEKQQIEAERLVL